MIELTENLLYKLEEKVMQLMSEAEGLRQQLQRLQHENASFRQEKENHTRKLQDLVSLLDSVNPSEHVSASVAQPFATVMPIIVQDAAQG